MLPIVLYSVHLFWSLRTLNGGLAFEWVSRFQGRDRTLYAVMGLAMAASMMLPPGLFMIAN